MKELIEKIKTARFIWVCGNGGSAATAEHLANDLFSKGIKVICLSSNTSIMTMIANDFGYPHVFSRQLDTLANDEDLLITISCSGTSRNIVSAINIAREMRMDTYQFEVFNNNKNYGALEDKHIQLVHQIKKAL